MAKMEYPIVIVPGRSDVLLCRGKVYVNHVGNIRYRGIIESLLEQYDRSSKSHRQLLGEEVLRIVHDDGGRFLKDDEGIWIEADYKFARRQICLSFRTLLYDTVNDGGENSDDEQQAKNKCQLNPQANGGSKRNIPSENLAEIDSTDNTSSKVAMPTRNDVLLGRGKGHFNHVGNIRFRGLVEDSKKLYDNATRHERTKISEEVIAVVHGYGGRFLKDDGDGTWIVIDDKAARLKVSHSFRALREVPSSSKKKDDESTSSNVATRGKKTRGRYQGAPITTSMVRK